MRHPDIDLLTQFALDDPLALDAATLVHITDCAECRHEIAQVQRVVDATLAAGGRSDLRTLEAPPPELWERIIAEVEAAEAATPRRPVATDLTAVPIQSRGEPGDDALNWPFARPTESTAATSAAELPTSRRTVGIQLVAATIVGLVVGAGFAWVLKDDNSTPPTDDAASSSSSLLPFGDHHASGEITLTDGSPRTVEIDLNAGSRAKGYLEVWLLDAETDGMISLGLLNGGTGSFAVAANVDLSTYDQIDISVEPFDGDPAHAADSLARGPVPTLDEE